MAFRASAWVVWASGAAVAIACSSSEPNGSDAQAGAAGTAQSGAGAAGQPDASAGRNTGGSGGTPERDGGAGHAGEAGEASAQGGTPDNGGLAGSPSDEGGASGEGGSPIVCTPGTMQCTSATQLRTCGPDGQWGLASTCQFGCGGDVCLTDYALQFDGIDDIVTVPYATSLDATTALTLEAWVYATSAMGGAIGKHVGHGRPRR